MAGQRRLGRVDSDRIVLDPILTRLSLGGAMRLCTHLRAVRKDRSVARLRILVRAEVLAAAQAECQARGWPWREPAKVTGGLFRFRVWTNANLIDGNHGS
jgi:hypothetical protein